MKCCKYISFGKLNIKMLSFVALIFLNIINLIVLRNIKYDNPDNEHNIYLNNFFFNSIQYFFSLTLSGLLWIIIVKRLPNTKKVSSSENTNQDTSNLTGTQQVLIQQETKYKKNRWNKQKLVIYVICICIVSRCFSLYISTADFTIKRASTFTLISFYTEIISLFLFSYFFIKTMKIYRHHKVSIIIICLLFILVNGFTLNEQCREGIMKLGIKFLIMQIISDILQSLEFVLGTFYLLKTDGNISKLCFFVGLFGMIFILIIYFISFFSIDCEILFSENDKNNCEGKKIKLLFDYFKYIREKDLLGLINIVCNFGIYYLHWYIIYYFSVNHLSSIKSFYGLFFVRWQRINFNCEVHLMYYILCIIIVFMTFVFNEIIILNFCGLEKDTKEKIAERAISDIDEINIGDNDDENDDIKPGDDDRKLCELKDNKKE